MFCDNILPWIDKNKIFPYCQPATKLKGIFILFQIEYSDLFQILSANRLHRESQISCLRNSKRKRKAKIFDFFSYTNDFQLFPILDYLLISL